MAKRPALPPFPDSPGAWIACFRHRAQVDGIPLSPEELGRRIGRSGSTVRRWESNRLMPDEGDIARLSSVCALTPIQTAFLSLACTRTRALPPPDGHSLRAYLRDALDVPYPAILLDGLFHVRAWNSYVDAVRPGTSRSFQREAHPLALILQSNPLLFRSGAEYEESRQAAARIFWISTAMHSHRPEYAEVLRQLSCEPGFRAMWMNLALGCAGDPDEPVTLTHLLADPGACFRIFSRTITYPPTYYMHEYHPQDNAAAERLKCMVEQGPPEVHMKRELHWVREIPTGC